MFRKRWMAAFVFVLLATGVWTAMASSLIEQRAVLSGEVVSSVAAGTQVSEGTELVRVTTLAGSATAARASAKGVVKEILVHPGDQIKSGDVVVRIEAQ